MTDLIAKWSGCWCGPQLAEDHDPRVRDCPQHGSDDCRHMAEGIIVDLRALAEAGIGPVAEAERRGAEAVVEAIETLAETYVMFDRRILAAARAAAEQAGGQS